MSKVRICVYPQPLGVGGMVSFQARLLAGLEKRGVDFTTDLLDTPYSAVLVIGGTRHLGGLRRSKQAGIPIVQRLDGMNWLHRKRATGLRHFLRAEWGNFLLAFIRSRLATRLVYQSTFARNWWEKEHGTPAIPSRVIYNGVDLNEFTPHGPEKPPAVHWRILLVEGTLGGGYEMGMESAVGLAETLAHSSGRAVELMVAGRVPDGARMAWSRRTTIPIRWAGLVGRADIPALDRAAHLLYSADIHPACPNAVIEALACGLPVVAFETGALAELVTGDAGRLADYGGDAWRLERPDVDGLAEAAGFLLADLPRHRKAARRRAEQAFGLERMLDEYLAVLGV